MNFKLSRDKIILLIITVSVVLVTWFLVIAPKWKNNIINDIEKANYCEIDDDCVESHFDGLVCISYVNKKELENIYKKIDLYHLTTFDYTGCRIGVLKAWSAPPVCKDKKCISKY